ncbi:MAG: anti-sigma factor domain-containing protein [Acidimicrobiales bacterium]
MTHIGPVSDHPLDNLAAYATDALDPAEQQAVDDHLAHCSACRSELADHRETLAALAPAEAPPTEVWQHITAAIGAPGLPDPHTGAPGMAVHDHAASSSPVDEGRAGVDDTVAPVSSLAGAEAARARARRPSPLRWAAAVVAAASVAGALGFALGNSSDDADIGSLAQRALEEPDGVLATLADGEGQPVARVVADEDGAFMLLEALQDLPEGRAYQLWSVGGPEPVSLGMLGRDGTNTVAFRLPPTITELAISVAPTTGDSTPSGVFRAYGSVLE